MPKSIRLATESDIPTAAAVLAEAFDSYPWTRWSIPSEGYSERLERLQALYLSHAVEHGVVLVDDEVSGVAAILPPTSPEPAEHVQVEIAGLMGERLEPVFGVELPQRPADSWDFATLGVRPSRAGQGIGSALIRAALTAAAASDHPRVSLETSLESNVALYERHGFAVTHRTQIEEGPVVYTMGIEL